MKTISYDGVAAATTDELADAVLDLAIAVARFSRYQQVTIPVVVAGEQQQLTLMLGPTIHLSCLTLPASDEVPVDGAAEVAEQLRARTRALTEPLHVVGDLDPAQAAEQ